MTSAVLAEAQRLSKLGYACAGLRVSGTATGKKLSGWQPGWQRSTSDTCMEYFNDSCNGLVLCTGEHSDVLALDLDRLKPDDAAAGYSDGLELMHSLLQQHEPLQGVPIQVTGSGGEHMLFSLSKSLEAGLDNPKNQTKLRVDGKVATIDIRADNGCIVVSPSAYLTLDGEAHQYFWQVPLDVESGKLSSMPSWLIGLVNDSSEPVREQHSAYPNKRRAVTPSFSSSYSALTMDTVQKALGPIAKVWPRVNGYDLAPVERLSCGQCSDSRVHDSNNWLVRRIISTCFYMRNYSSECKTKVFGQDVQALQGLLAAPDSDDRIVRVLQLVTRDMGHELKYTGKNWLCFQGLIWQPLSDIEIKRRIKLEVNYEVVERLLKIVQKQGNLVENMADTKSMVDKLRKANRFLMKASNVASVAETAKALLLDEGIAGQLDTNKDIIGCSSGVIELRTGSLRKASTIDYLSRKVEAEYLGVDKPTPDIDAFFTSVFDSQEVIDFVQRLLGYAITGHTSEQKWLIMTGRGGNGKSLLLGLLSKLLGPTMYCTPAREVFFESGRQTAAGGHTAHLVPLVNKLIVAREELNKSDRLDVAMIKAMTGDSDIVSRAPYSTEYTTFKPTHLPILACNHLPPIDVTDEATLRRLVVLPFRNLFVGPGDRVSYDPSNPHHRVKDPTLKDKLSTPAAQTQLLTWLVRGAKMWYERGLADIPEVLQESLKGYICDNDVLHQLLEEECEIVAGASINAKEFRERLGVLGRKVAQKVLQPDMEKRGFILKVVWQQHLGKADRAYVGLRWKA